MNANEILQMTGLSLENYNFLMGLSGILCGFLFVWILLNVVLNIK